LWTFTACNIIIYSYNTTAFIRRQVFKFSMFIIIYVTVLSYIHADTFIGRHIFCTWSVNLNFFYTELIKNHHNSKRVRNVKMQVSSRLCYRASCHHAINYKNGIFDQNECRHLYKITGIYIKHCSAGIDNKLKIQIIYKSFMKYVFKIIILLYWYRNQTVNFVLPGNEALKYT